MAWHLRLLLSVVGLVPLVSHVLLPVLGFGHLSDSVLDDSEGLSNLIIVHIFFIVKFIGEFEQLVDLSLLVLLCLLFGDGPSWLLSISLVASLAASDGARSLL